MILTIESNIIELLEKIRVSKLDIQVAIDRYDSKEYNDILLWYCILVKCDEVKKQLNNLSLNLYALKGFL